MYACSGLFKQSDHVMNQEGVHKRVRVLCADRKHALVKQGVIDVVASIPQRPNCTGILKV